MAEVDEEAAEVFGVFFDAVIEVLDVLLLEEFQDAFFEDAGAFAGEQAPEECGRLVVDWVSGGQRRVCGG